jgi:beta-galactosidase/beta-glucuronidase
VISPVAWWPDGQYTAPTDEALAFDIEAVQKFGLNTIRLHQKVNSERWYFHADRLGVLVLQDAVQHFEYKGEPGAQRMSTDYFKADWKAAIEGRSNHPAIIQVVKLASLMPVSVSSFVFGDVGG